MKAPLEQRTIVHVLREGAAAAPERPAIVDERGSVTYAHLLERSMRVAGGLSSLGIGSGDTVLLMLDNHADHALSWFGTNMAGGAIVPVNTAFRGDQLAYVTNHSESRVLVVDEGYLDRFAHIAEQLTGVDHLVVRGDPEAARGLGFAVSSFEELVSAEPSEPVHLDPWDVLGVMYTSGTTGRSKGVLVSQAQTYGRMWPLQLGAPQQGDTTLVTLPMYHVIGQCRGLYNTLIATGTAVVQQHFSASKFWDTCRRHGVTFVPLVGVMASYLLKQPAREDDRDHPVERVGLGTTIPEVDEFAERFGVEMSTSYGLTEVGGALVGPARAKGCGYVRPDFEGMLVDEQDRPVPQGEIGELVLRGKEPWTVMLGYLKNPEATVEKWRNLWLHTGDLMYQQPDGEFVFVDRRAESIRRKGENISSMEVEEGVAAHPSVAEVAVVGVESEDQEVELKAVVVPRAGQEVDLPELVAFLAENMPYFMVPRFFAVVDALPRTESTHRVQKVELARTGTTGAWDREAVGLQVTRAGLVRQP